MLLEEFIITVFCWVEDYFELVTGGVKLRTGGFAPRLSDSEAITLEIVGELLGHDAMRRSGVISSGIGRRGFPVWGIGAPSSDR